MRNRLRFKQSLVYLLFLVCLVVFTFATTGQSSAHAANPLSRANPPHTHIGDWLQYGYSPQHTGFNPTETTLSPANVSHLTLAWKAPTNTSAQASQPALANGIIYYASNTQVYGFQASTGKQLWTDTIGGIEDNASPIVSNGVVYICASLAHASLYALDAQTGKILWTQSIGVLANAPAAPTLANGVIYEGWDNGRFYAFNASTGKILWSVPMYQIYASPAIYNGIVYVSSDDELYALNTQNGQTVWKVQIGGYSNSAPTIVDGVVYVAGGAAGGGSSESQLSAFNAQTGKALWIDGPQNGVPAITSPSSLAIANNILYLYSGEVYAFSTLTGKLLWSTHTGNTGTTPSSSPIVANGIVYVGAFNHDVYAFNARTGAVLWSYTTQGFVYAVPIVVNGMLYIGSEDGNLYAFHLASAA